MCLTNFPCRYPILPHRQREAAVTSGAGKWGTGVNVKTPFHRRQQSACVRSFLWMLRGLSWRPGWSDPARWSWFSQTATAGWEKTGRMCSWRSAARWGCSRCSCYWPGDTDSCPAGRRERETGRNEKSFHLSLLVIFLGHHSIFLWWCGCQQEPFQHCWWCVHWHSKVLQHHYVFYYYVLTSEAICLSEKLCESLMVQAEARGQNAVTIKYHLVSPKSVTNVFLYSNQWSLAHKNLSSVPLAQHLQLKIDWWVEATILLV